MSTEAEPTLEVALCQAALRPVASVDELTDRVDDLFDRAGAADLYVLPELLGVSVGLDAAGGTAEADSILDADQGARLHAFLADAAAERDAVIVGGSYNVIDEATGERRNRCPIATPDGVEGYDKRHPIPEERAGGKVAGRAPPPVVTHHGVGVGVLVCYDVEFPETVRDLVDRGAEVIAVPSWTATEAGYQRVTRCAAARAIENQCYVATVPLIGDRPGFEGTGRASVFAPCDDVVGDVGTPYRLPRDEEAVGSYTLDVGALRRSRTGASVRPYADARGAFDHSSS